MGFANYIFNELCWFWLGTANIFRKMIGLQEATWSKEEENKKDAEVEYETWKVEENITF
jgi:hypothetical protein